jgi:hypothetical protein
VTLMVSFFCSESLLKLNHPRFAGRSIEVADMSSGIAADHEVSEKYRQRQWRRGVTALMLQLEIDSGLLPVL